MIGWFGIPGRKGGDQKVHIVREGYKPLCGTSLRPDAEFQYCGQEGVAALRWVNCKKCRKGIEEK